MADNAHRAPPACPTQGRRRFQRRLNAWYAHHGRDLPWRRTADPYRILVSEIMLQQTQVERVIPKYHEFLERYPTLEVSPGPRARDVRQTWRPLGYKSARYHLHGIARETVARYDGRFPLTRPLRACDGIGRYTAGAILSVSPIQPGHRPRRHQRRGACSGRVFLGPRRLLRARGERTCG